jgi:hypothetical protein
MPKAREDVKRVVKVGREVEVHPAFGVARVSRITSHPGETLFQSDLSHRHYMQITFSEATRERNLKDDWVFPEKVVFQASMSMSQFASLVSCTDSEGVPVTLEWAGTGSYPQGDRPGLYPQPRLAATTAEVRQAADEAFAHVREAFEAYQEIMSRKSTAAEKRHAMSGLASAIANAPANVEYAAMRLNEHAEAVVEKSRADIEAMVSEAQRYQTALPPSPAGEIGA